MARNSARPGRTVAVFFIGLAVAYGLVALVGTWKPALGLDLEGGTQITLTAKGQRHARTTSTRPPSIIDSRVNGSGVTEAEVTTQGSNEIVVQVPGTTQEQPGRDRRPPGPAAVPPGRAGAADAPAPRRPARRPSRRRRRPALRRRPAPSASRARSPSDEAAGKNRPPALLGKDQQAASTHDAEARRRRRARARRQPSPTPRPPTARPTSTTEVHYTAANQKAFRTPLTWMTNPDPQSVAVYNAFTCPPTKPVVGRPDHPAGHLRRRRTGNEVPAVAGA